MLRWKYDSSIYEKNHEEIFACFLTSKSYILGVLSLAYSLSKVGALHPFYAVVPDLLVDDFSPELTRYGVRVLSLPMIAINEEKLNNSVVSDNLDYWKNTFFKLQVSKMTAYKKIVLLDADMIVLKNIDHVFRYEHMSAVAAGNIKHPDWIQLNSGFVVIVPTDDFELLIQDSIPTAFNELLTNKKSFGDQDIFNYCYQEWPNQKNLHLPEIYNAMSDCINLVASKYGRNHIYIAHFIGKEKPWNRPLKYAYTLFKEAVKTGKMTEFLFYVRYIFYLVIIGWRPKLFRD